MFHGPARELLLLLLPGRRAPKGAPTFAKASQAPWRGERTARTRRRSCPAALAGGSARLSLSMPCVRS